MDIPKETLKTLYYRMNLTRHFEERVEYYIVRGRIHGTTHLCIGEEATAVGACALLDDDDYMTSTHRGHGHSIGKGADVNRMFAELFGKENGYCRGKGGSMHIADVEQGNLGANGIVAGGVAIAAGAGLTIRMKNQDRVVVSFFGDGALNQGVFHESINIAAVWNLPVIYFCENNQYAMSLSRKKGFKNQDLSQRAIAYGIEGTTIDGNDVFQVYDTVKWAREHVKENGPVLIIAETYRYKGHSKSDKNRYRTKEEIEEWQKQDPIVRMRKRLEEEKILKKKELDEIEESAKKAVDDAVEFAQNSPDAEVRDILDGVYA
jgi:pyruvate dehydrogenase E1 component alpha subunit